KRLEGQVAVVTGASRGIGRACAEELAREGAAVVVNYHESKGPAEALAAEIVSKGGRSIAFGASVGNPDECKALIDKTIETYGQVDILVNNAGVNRDRVLKRLSVDEWNEVINTDLNSAFYCTSAAIRHMIDRNYAAAKAGLIAFAKSTPKEQARNNITVNAMCPGFVETDMVIALSDEVKAALLKQIPLGRFGKPEEVASFVRYLCTEGDWITGQQFNPNGGQYM